MLCYSFVNNNDNNNTLKKNYSQIEIITYTTKKNNINKKLEKLENKRTELKN